MWGRGGETKAQPWPSSRLLLGRGTRFPPQNFREWRNRVAISKTPMKARPGQRPGDKGTRGARGEGHVGDRGAIGRFPLPFSQAPRPRPHRIMVGLGDA